MRRVIAVVMLLAGLLTGLIAWRIRAQRDALEGPASGSGVVEGEGVDVSARISARVAQVVAAEGAELAAGAPLLLLECDEPRARLTEAEARLASSRAQALAAGAQAQAAHGQSSAARASIGASAGQVGALGAQYEVAAREAARVEGMGEHAALSARDRARSAADGLAEQERAARATQLASRRQASAALSQAEAATAQAEAARESVRALEALVGSARLLVEECTIRAPRAGVVERVYYDPGELVMPGAAVARVVDPKVVRATFYLANGDIDEARVGMAAELVADAYPGRRFAATVSRVALDAEFTPRNVQTRSDRDRLVFPVEVRVDRHDRLLRPGMPVTVTLPRSAR
jgi:HlyD family secretion protein